MRRISKALLLVAAATTSVAAFVGALAAAAPASQVFPILECVFHDTGTGKYNALWGYNNNSQSSTTIAVGSDNGFWPGSQGQGQPTTFQSGEHDNVFTVTWSGSGSLTWTVTNHSASATSSSTACSKNPVPMVGVQTVLWVALGVAAAGVIVVVRRRRAPPRPARVHS